MIAIQPKQKPRLVDIYPSIRLYARHKSALLVWHFCILGIRICEE